MGNIEGIHRRKQKEEKGAERGGVGDERHQAEALSPGVPLSLYCLGTRAPSPI